MAAPVKERRHQAAPVWPVRLGPRDVLVERGPDGAIHLKSPHALAPYPAKLTERLDYWAATAPERAFLAQRDATGDWRKLTYAETLVKVRRIAAALLQRELSPERPIAILSGNDIEHALLGLAAMYVGVPYAPISPAYSLISQDFGKLRSIIALLTPGLIFTADGDPYRRAIEAAVPPDVEVVVARNPLASRPTPRSARTPSSSSCSPRARPARRRR
jgi:feruloyl-CoA synthase